MSQWCHSWLGQPNKENNISKQWAIEIFITEQGMKDWPISKRSTTGTWFSVDDSEVINNKWNSVKEINHLADVLGLVFLLWNVNWNYLFGSDFSYRLNPSSKLPDWYTPVNLVEDKRRWNAD